MTKEYVGARYVPKFYENSLDPSSCEWENNVNYEPLTVVTVDNDHCYISKKTVPSSIGTPAQNAEYWLDQGSYSAYIQQLQNEIDDINNNKIPSLSDRIDELSERHFLLVSDSYGEPFSGGSTWEEVFGSIVGSQNVTITYAGGYGFSPNGYNAPFINLITPGTNPTGLPANYDVEKPTDIIVGGGFNDRSTASNTLLNAIIAFCNYARTTFPNLRNIYIAALGWSMNAEHLAELNGGDYIETYANCGRAGAIYIAGSENIMKSFDFFKNEVDATYALGYKYVHPNTTAANVIASKIYGSIKGNACSVLRKRSAFTINLDAPLRSNALGVISIGERQHDGFTYIEFAQNNFDKSTGATFSIAATKTEIPLCKIDKGFFNCDSEITVPCRLFVAGGSYTGNVGMTGYYRINAGVLSLVIDDLTAQSGTCTNIYVYDGSCILVPNI